MIHSLFIINKNGEVLIEKHWRGITSRSVSDYFWEQVSAQSNPVDVPPVMNSGRFYLVSIQRNGLYILGVVTQEVAPLLVIEFLHRCCDIFQDYFSAVDEQTLKDNFSTVYQLLEEMLDHGYALTTEPNALKAMIQPPSILGKMGQSITGGSGVADILPDGTISSMPWRKTNVKYTQNEIYFDIIEEINAITNPAGQMVQAEVGGIIQSNCRLSGVPDLTLAFVDPSVIDDCSFHPCVRYSRFERDRVVSFVPPDGHFELMKYRVAINSVGLPLYCEPRIAYNGDRGTVSVMVGERSMPTLAVAPKQVITVEEISVKIFFPKAVVTADFEASVGKCLFDQSTQSAVWTIGKLGKHKAPSLTGKVSLSSTAKVSEDTPPVLLNFKVPGTTVSGLAVETLALTNEKYKPYKGVKTMVKSGKIQFRVQ